MRRIYETQKEAEAKMRMVHHDISTNLVGYDAAKEMIAFLLRVNATKENYHEFKEDALAVALAKVYGRKFLEEMGENLRIQTEQDVQMSIKELIRATGIGGSVDDFIISVAFSN